MFTPGDELARRGGVAPGLPLGATALPGISRPFERTAEGFINNCALHNGDDEENCQVCVKACPDKGRVLERARRGLPLDVLPPEDERLSAGDEVSWTAGKELFCPIKFHAFEVGPVAVTTCLRPGETATEALGRAKATALAAWQAEFEEKLAGHLERVRRAAGQAIGASPAGK